MAGVRNMEHDISNYSTVLYTNRLYHEEIPFRDAIEFLVVDKGSMHVVEHHDDIFFWKKICISHRASIKYKINQVEWIFIMLLGLNDTYNNLI